MRIQRAARVCAKASEVFRAVDGGLDPKGPGWWWAARPLLVKLCRNHCQQLSGG